MKRELLVWLGAIAIVLSCNTKSRYLDLSTNERISLKKDTTSGYTINSRTGEPVDMYVDTKTHDTIYGITGEIVNGRVHRTEEGKWVVKVARDEYQAKPESENRANVKQGGDEYKSEHGSYEVKMEGNHDVKIENGKTQIKIDGKTEKHKVKKDKNITEQVKKAFQ